MTLGPADPIGNRFWLWHRYQLQVRVACGDWWDVHGTFETVEEAEENARGLEFGRPVWANVVTRIVDRATEEGARQEHKIVPRRWMDGLGAKSDREQATSNQ